ncbi:hypothetical protein AAMO2058_001447700 [Amorphochlora amoebiformis]|eukprot:1357759-Amorphochlora_amoeboformis.AAC.1
MSGRQPREGDGPSWLGNAIYYSIYYGWIPLIIYVATYGTEPQITISDILAPEMPKDGGPASGSTGGAGRG